MRRRRAAASTGLGPGVAELARGGLTSLQARPPVARVAG